MNKFNKLCEKVLNEKKYFIEVSVKTASDANEILKDQFKGMFKATDTNNFEFKKEDDAYDALESLKDMGIEIVDTNMNE